MNELASAVDALARTFGASVAGSLIRTATSALVPVQIFDESPPPGRVAVSPQSSVHAAEAAASGTRRSPHVGARDDVRVDVQPSTHIVHESGFVVPGSTWMLKVAWAPEERTGLEVQLHAGDSMVEIVLAGHGLLWLEGDQVPVSFALMELGVPVHQGSFSDRALEALCDARKLVRTNSGQLTDLSAWFSSLTLWRCPLAASILQNNAQGGHSTQRGTLHLSSNDLLAAHRDLISRAQADARDLLANPLDSVFLHGDVHHANLIEVHRGADTVQVLTDPKGLFGESLFDYVNMMFNPDAADPRAVALFDQRLDLVMRSLATLGLPLDECALRFRFLRWIRAYGCLSALWHLEDDAANIGSAKAMLDIALLADQKLERYQIESLPR